MTDDKKEPELKIWIDEASEIKPDVWRHMACTAINRCGKCDICTPKNIRDK